MQTLPVHGRDEFEKNSTAVRKRDTYLNRKHKDYVYGKC